MFSQATEAQVPAERIAAQAERYFDVRVESDPDGASTDGVTLRVTLPSGSETDQFRITSRAVLPADLRAAQEAESRGRAAGMADLAARCTRVWEVAAETNASEAATLTLCAVLASTALGPVLPDDRSTLFGVRGAMERVKRLERRR